jgi:quercetin dioxygenase-like cupin family protein
MSQQPPTQPTAPLHLASAITTQPAGIVSRVILKAKNGNVTLFAFDTGQELSEHTAPFDALVTVFEGEALITVGGTPHNVPAGAALLMPANVPHALRAAAPMKMMLTMIRG